MSNTQTKLKILVGPVWTVGLASCLFKAYSICNENENLDLKIFSYHDGADVRITSSSSFQDILLQLGNWEPDLIFYQEVTSGPLLKGIEDIQIPIVGIITDGWIYVDKIKQIIPFFDVFVTCESYIADFLRSHGCKYIIEHPFHGYLPELHHKMEGVPKEFDISYIGVKFTENNSPIYAKRFRYLKKITDYFEGGKNICIKSDTFGEEYVYLLNASKIIFNYSPTDITHIITSRIYETMACGSLIFIEDTNTDAKKLFKDREHCVYYNDENLLELLEYYLSHDEEREKIAYQGHLIAPKFSLDNQIMEIIEEIKSINFSDLTNYNLQRKTTLPENIKLIRSFSILYSTLSDLSSAKDQLYSNLSSNIDLSETENSLGFVYTSMALSQGMKPDYIKKAITYYKKAVLRNPDSVIYLFNLAHSTLLLLPYKSEILFYNCLKKLENLVNDESIFSGMLHTGYHSDIPVYLWIYDSSRFAFRWAIYRLWQFVMDKPSYLDLLRKTLIAQCWNKIGEILTLKEENVKAIDAFYTSLNHIPDDAVIMAKLAECLSYTRNFKEAENKYLQALKLEPYNEKIKEAYLKMLKRN